MSEIIRSAIKKDKARCLEHNQAFYEKCDKLCDFPPRGS